MTKPDPALLPVFQDGESVTIQRNVRGQNVMMVLVVEDPCSISPRGLVLRGRFQTWGVSSYADGRVATQRDALDRLTKERQRVLELAVKHGVTEIIDLLAPVAEEELEVNEAPQSV
jgi:hypothetical protein